MLEVCTKKAGNLGFESIICGSSSIIAFNLLMNGDLDGKF